MHARAKNPTDFSANASISGAYDQPRTVTLRGNSIRVRPALQRTGINFWQLTAPADPKRSLRHGRAHLRRSLFRMAWAAGGCSCVGVQRRSALGRPPALLAQSIFCGFGGGLGNIAGVLGCAENGESDGQREYPPGHSAEDGDPAGSSASRRSRKKTQTGYRHGGTQRKTARSGASVPSAIERWQLQRAEGFLNRIKIRGMRSVLHWPRCRCSRTLPGPGAACCRRFPRHWPRH